MNETISQRYTVRGKSARCHHNVAAATSNNNAITTSAIFLKGVRPTPST